MDTIEAVISAARELGLEVIENALLKNYTTFRVGGKCGALIKINSSEACTELRELCEKRNVRYFIIGNGSNLIVDDDGFDGIIFFFGKEFSEIRLVGETGIFCEAGTSLSKLCSFALDNSLSGLEFAWGIPGTVGGAVFMNAGAYTGEIKDVIEYCDIIDEDNAVKRLNKDELELSYRHSSVMGTRRIIIGASFVLQKGNHDEIRAKMDDFMSRRKEKQPLEFASAGSTFKRPAGSYASLLIDECGLKGYSVGDAQVSEKHAGFVINRGSASFSDIMSLIEDVKRTVKEKTGYELECEPVIISDKTWG